MQRRQEGLFYTFFLGCDRRVPNKAVGRAVSAPPRAAAAPSFPARVVGVSLRRTFHMARLTPRANRSDRVLAKALEAARCLRRLVGGRARIALSICAIRKAEGRVARAPG